VWTTNIIYVFGRPPPFVFLKARALNAHTFPSGVGSSMAKILSIACSTFGNRLAGALEVFYSLSSADEKVAFVVVHQVPPLFELSKDAQALQSDLMNMENIHYILSETEGLTKSRNLALEHCQTKYVWIMDDDIIFANNILQPVMERLQTAGSVACHTFESIKPSGQARAAYPKDRAPLCGKGLLKVASFEMIVNKDILIRNKINFREDMGVGGNAIGLGEESVLISDIIRAGEGTMHHKISVLTHPDVSTGNTVSEKNFYSKGVVIRRCFTGSERIFFYLRDVFRIFRNKEDHFGAMYFRVKLVKALTKGCFLGE